MRVDTAASAAHAALEDLYVVYSDGLLLRHRLQVWLAKFIYINSSLSDIFFLQYCRRVLLPFNTIYD